MGWSNLFGIDFHFASFCWNVICWRYFISWWCIKHQQIKYPIIVAIGLDENRISQLIGFGIIPRKSSDNFYLFFEQLSQKYSVRVFVCDRLRAQAKSIKKYFNSHLLYCKIHIRRNIISYLNSDLLESFNKLLIHVISKDEFLNILKKVKTETVEGQKQLKYQ